MALRDRIAYLRKEHKEMVQLANQIESALTLGAKADFPEHRKCITALRALEHGFQGIEEHCHAEERVVESTYHHYVKSSERRRLDSQHAEIMRGLADFREELRYATADRTEALRGPGMALVTRLRSHIVHEEKLLREVWKSEVGKRRVTKSRPAKRAGAKTSVRMTKRTEAISKETSNIPYTMESHPEL